MASRFHQQLGAAVQQFFRRLSDGQGTSLDHTGLWHYLNGACPGTDTRAGIKGCLDGWSSGVIFDSSIGGHPRFVAVPIFTTQPNAPGNYLIDHFAPVWLKPSTRTATRTDVPQSTLRVKPVRSAPAPIRLFLPSPIADRTSTGMPTWKP